jgi:hypothetical protein
MLKKGYIQEIVPIYISGIHQVTLPAKKLFEGFGDLKLGQVIRTVKYAEESVLLTKKSTVLHGIIQKLTETGRCHEMEINVGRGGGDSGNMNLKGNIPIRDYDGSKTTSECGLFQPLGWRNVIC